MTEVTNWMYLSKDALEEAIFTGLLTKVQSLNITIEGGRILGEVDGNAFGYCGECDSVWANEEPVPCNCFGQKGEMRDE